MTARPFMDCCLIWLHDHNLFVFAACSWPRSFSQAFHAIRPGQAMCIWGWPVDCCSLSQVSLSPHDTKQHIPDGKFSNGHCHRAFRSGTGQACNNLLCFAMQSHASNLCRGLGRQLTSAAKGLGIMSLGWTMGSTLGPAFGGALSEPCKAFGPGFVQCGAGELFQARWATISSCTDTLTMLCLLSSDVGGDSHDCFVSSIMAHTHAQMELHQELEMQSKPQP